MQRALSLCLAVVALAWLSLATPLSGRAEPQAPQPSIQQVPWDGQAVLERIQFRGGSICCARGRADWWTSRGACRAARGVIVNPRRCLDNVASRNVCCVRRGRDWWTTARDCRFAGGRVTSPGVCRRR